MATAAPHHIQSGCFAEIKTSEILSCAIADQHYSGTGTQDPVYTWYGSGTVWVRSSTVRIQDWCLDAAGWFEPQVRHKVDSEL